MGEFLRNNKFSLLASVSVHVMLLAALVYASTRPEVFDLAERGGGGGAVSVALLSPPSQEKPKPTAAPPKVEPTPAPPKREEKVEPKATPEPKPVEKVEPVVEKKPEPTATPRPRPTSTPRPEPTPRPPKVEPPKEKPKATPKVEEKKVATPKPTTAPAVMKPKSNITYPSVPNRNQTSEKPAPAAAVRTPGKSGTTSYTRTNSNNPGNSVGGAENAAGSIKGVGLPAYYARTALETLARNFIVPQEQQRNITAELGCRISRDGTISNIRIRRSSGSSELDQMAVAALEKTRRFPPFPDDFDKPHVDVEITFNFQL